MRKGIRWNRSLLNEPHSAKDWTLRNPLSGKTNICSKPLVKVSFPFSGKLLHKNYAYGKKIRPHLHCFHLKQIKHQHPPASSSKWFHLHVDELKLNSGLRWYRSFDLASPVCCAMAGMVICVSGAGSHVRWLLAGWQHWNTLVRNGSQPYHLDGRKVPSRSIYTDTHTHTHTYTPFLAALLQPFRANQSCKSPPLPEEHGKQVHL